MSKVEMEIKLVDGTEAEQAAFDRSPSESEAGGVPSIGGVDSPNAARSDTVEAITAGFATITDKESKDDFQHDSTPSVAAIHEQLAAITNGTHEEKPTHQQGDPSEGKAEAPSGEDYRGFRVSLEQLVQRFTAKFFSDPIDRLIASLSQPSQTVDNQAPEVIAPPVQTPENRETQAGPPPVQTSENRAPIIPAVGHVAPKQDEGGDVPPVGHVAPKAGELTAKPVGVNDIIAKVQQRIAKIPVVGKRINGAINAVRSTAKKYQGGLTKVAKSITGAIGKTKAGKAFLASGSKLASKIKGSSIGKAVAGAGRSVVGAVARTVGATAAGGAVVSGGTGVATTVAAGGTTAAAGGGAPAVAAGAALLVNPVGLAVGAVVVAFSGLVLATKALNDTFTSEADRLEKYSANIAIARGNKQINTELNMMDRAKRIGGALGENEKSKAQMNSTWEKLGTDILSSLTYLQPLFSKGIDLGTLALQAVRQATVKTNSTLAAAQQAAAQLTPGLEDDKAAKLAVDSARDAQNELNRDMLETMNRLLNITTPDQNGDDPFLRSLLNAKF